MFALPCLFTQILPSHRDRNKVFNVMRFASALNVDVNTWTKDSNVIIEREGSGRELKMLLHQETTLKSYHDLVLDQSMVKLKGKKPKPRNLHQEVGKILTISHGY